MLGAIICIFWVFFIGSGLGMRCGSGAVMLLLFLFILRG